MSELNRTYLDTETTGLDPYRHEIIEIAFVVEAIPETPLVAGKILDKWVTKIKPLHLGVAHPQALQVNGYDPVLWKDAPTFAEVAPMIVSYVSRATCLIGHNPKFDTEFVKSMCARDGIDIKVPYHQIDTVTAAWMALMWMGGEDVKLRLDSLRDRLEIPRNTTHGALKDALDCRRLIYAAREHITGVKIEMEPYSDC